MANGDPGSGMQRRSKIVADEGSACPNHPPVNPGQSYLDDGGGADDPACAGGRVVIMVRHAASRYSAHWSGCSTSALLRCGDLRSRNYCAQGGLNPQSASESPIVATVKGMGAWGQPSALHRPCRSPRRLPHPPGTSVARRYSVAGFQKAAGRRETPARAPSRCFTVGAEVTPARAFLARTRGDTMYSEAVSKCRLGF